MSLDKYWEPRRFEREIYERWESSGAFVANAQSGKPPFVISMPPPNATGTLHSGHAVMLAIEDVMIRYRRMRGDEVLWLPGTDHAAIATESVVIRNLQSSGVADPRRALGREGLLSEIADYVAKSRDRIREQIRAMGSSCDWSRERYTMDPQLNRCVNGVFARMFRDGLIYRGPRIVNWDPALKTTVSDDEIYHEERTAKFYTIRYGPFLVGTSRPETKLGDTAIAVHPDDARYREYVGRTIEVNWPQGPTIVVRVVADEAVDPEFGSGALGVTPAHSQIDFEIAARHGIPLVQVIDEDGRMTAAAGERYQGMTVQECRDAFVADLAAAGLLAEVRDYTQKISLCYRSKAAIEPLPKAQWFIDVDEPAVPWGGKRLSIKQVLRSTVESGEIEILPDYQKKIFFHWVDNLRDWCISRQIWWGHRIPVYYRGEEDLYVGNCPPEGDGWVQDEDTLDTWFSSALWTWSTLITPELALDPTRSIADLLRESPDFQRFHPTSVMETGYDILFFWVARMILMTTYATGQVPFRVVYLHGLVLDKNGEKMSKSNPETCIDPLDVIAEYGADVLRLALLVGTSPGKDLKLGEERLKGCGRLITKLWNAAKLAERTAERIESVEGQARTLAEIGKPAHPVNRFLLARLDELIASVTDRLDALAFGEAAEQIRQSFWSEFCDFYLEAIKVPPLANLRETATVLRHGLTVYLKLFHPYIPFVTEFLWHELLGQADPLMSTDWPKVRVTASRSEASGVAAVLRLIDAVRSFRAERGIAPDATLELEIEPLADATTFGECAEIVKLLVRASLVRFIAAGEEQRGERVLAAMVVDPAFRLAIAQSAVDLEGERRRLARQLAEVRERREGRLRQLANENFVAKAKPEAVAGVRQRVEEDSAVIALLEEKLQELGGEA